MGHNGDIEAVYSTRKELRPEMVEEMRQAFAEASKYVQTKGEGPLEVAKQEFEAKNREYDDALTRIRLEALESKLLNREILEKLEPLLGRLAELETEVRELRKARQNELAQKG